ncbi:MAG: hypothetical protein KJ871_03430 [Alphaproteobacteria bacterium]|nr:hypothetical protein [Alphaproteobacteria bacterium]MBU2082626.1 hypothetical protein [Alphaproteobacteria bacterium]MBU2142277.1 hypothetical protein [Alphaproteobacteria bacterium]MBU2196680.1 hypothetical protein [Alphaproteobacteria bacterium]
MRILALPFLLLAAALNASAQTVPEVVRVEAILPYPQGDEMEPAPALEMIEDHAVVLLNLTMSVEAYPSFENEDGTFSQLEGDCEFGPMEGVRMMSVPTGSNHLLLNVRPGDPSQFAANSVSCDYMPSLQLGENIGQVMKVRGCYLANYHSIPTAAMYVLNPLPASACGLTQ